MSESPEDIRNLFRPLDLKPLTDKEWESLKDGQSEKIDAIKEVFDEQLADCRYLIKQTSQKERFNSVWRGRFKTLLILLTSGVAFANVAGQVTDDEGWVHFAVFVSLTATLFASRWIHFTIFLEARLSIGKLIIDTDISSLSSRPIGLTMSMHRGLAIILTQMLLPLPKV